MRKHIKKVFLSVVAMILVIVFICLTVFDRSTVAVAKDTLPGVEEIISQIQTEKETFRILEITPDSNIKELGYYFAGQEPINWETELVRRTTIQDRKTYVDSLYKVDSSTGTVTGAFAEIASTTADVTPLYYTPYEEKTSITAEQLASGEWKTITFVAPVEEIGLKGHYTDNSSGTGDYTKAVTGGAIVFIPESSDNYDATGQEETTDDNNITGYYITTPEIITYSYTPGVGNCNWVEDQASAEIYNVTLGKVYYKGSFTNQEWFKKYVFDLDAEEFSTFSINVTTLDPAEVNSYNLGTFDLIYVSNVNSTLDGISSGSYSTTNDISWSKAAEIFTMATQSGIPCIIDASILNNSALTETNLYKLVAMLSQTDTDTFYTTYFAPSSDVNAINTTINWSNIASGFVVDADKHFVKKNVYSFNRSSNPLVNYKFINVFTASEIALGFSDVLNEILSENLYRESDATGVYPAFSTDVSQAVAVKYIINYAYRRNIVIKTTVRILEIEPCASYELTPAIVSGWAPDLNLQVANITIDKMTTSEFVGKIKDLNGIYDLIYIGTNTGLMNIAASQTNFNDDNMDGLVYYHTGDIVRSKPELAGLLDNEYTGSNRANALSSNSYLFRYAGNDITKENYEALIDYVSANYPIVLADNFYTTAGAINTTRIDNSSYMYQFANKMVVDGKKNVFKKSVVGSSLFAFYLNRPKLSIELEDLIDVDGNGIYELNAENGKYYLDYYFTISNVGAASRDTKYNCRLYIDVNADGKYSGMEEIGDIKLSQNGTIVNQIGTGYQLTSGKIYHLHREVPDGYKGVLPWKIEISQVNNSYIRNSVSGYSVINSPEAEVIKILQIDSSGGTTLNLTNSSIFQNLFNEVRSKFDIQVTHTTTADFPTQWRNNNNILDNYNMLILGFDDCYTELDNTIGAVDGKGCVNGTNGILAFINKGKSVLFTHDTTSFVNTTQSKRSGMSDTVFWGYNFNTYIRAAVGMDRYGVLTSSLLKAGYGISKYASDGTTITSNWTALLGTKKDMAYQVNTGQTATVSQVQGYTYYVLNRYKSSATTTPTTPLYNLSAANTGVDVSGNGAYGASMKVSKVNDGQITNYPYQLPDTFTVSETHGQYYQLDLQADDDTDGESDIVVWYCLSDGNSSQDIYDASPNDVINNYYIYNKGNITYSGVGHSTISNVNEAKLFINTMIAAYNSGIKSPQISILENESSNSLETNYIYVPYDENRFTDATRGILNNEETIYFHVNDTNFVKGTKQILMNYYYEDPTSTTTIRVNGEDIKVTMFTPTTINIKTNLVANQSSLASEEMYKITVPTSYLKSNMNSVSIFFGVQSKIDSYGTVTITDPIYGKVDIVRTELFNLD